MDYLNAKPVRPTSDGQDQAHSPRSYAAQPSSSSEGPSRQQQQQPQEQNGQTAAENDENEGASRAAVVFQDEPEMMDSPVMSPSPMTLAESPTTTIVSEPEETPVKSRPTPKPLVPSVSRSLSGLSNVSSQAISSSSSLSPHYRPSNDSQNSNGTAGASGKGDTPTRRHTSLAHRNSSFEYRETLDATTKHLEDGSRIINQYKLGEMIGKGAYGNVFRASLLDDPSSTFAVKEFGKTRLRKNQRAQDRRKIGPGRKKPDGVVRRGGQVVNDGEISSALEKMVGIKLTSDDGKKVSTKYPQEDSESGNDPLSLIRHEIAILKKLHHPHLVRLYEVLDDPSYDELFMVFEYCADGTIIDVKLHEQVEPLDEETARKYLIQIMLGIEYLHHHDIVHRDVKPDNILLQNDRQTCKIVDFGVSEFFIKPGDDTMQKSAGSPAFMSPELCTAGRGELHGKKSDIWSLGVTFYSMVIGRLPFEKHQFLDLYESIKNDEPTYPDHLSSECRDLLQRLLKKDPADRITLEEMRTHPYISKNGQETVLSCEENIKDVVDEITAEEVDSAINRIANVFTLARAISRFKRAGSRASSAGSIGEITANLVSKGKDAASQVTTSLYTSTDKTTTDPSRDEKSEDQGYHLSDVVQQAALLPSRIKSHVKGSLNGEEKEKRQSSGESEPTLEHFAQAHVMLGSSNREWAASHIARTFQKATGHPRSNKKEVICEEDEEQQKQSASNGKDEDVNQDAHQSHHDDNPAANDAPSSNPTVASKEADGEKLGSHPILKELKSDKMPPKVLNDLPTVESPAIGDIKTPDGAGHLYRGKSG